LVYGRLEAMVPFYLIYLVPVVLGGAIGAGTAKPKRRMRNGTIGALGGVAVSGAVLFASRRKSQNELAAQEACFKRYGVDIAKGGYTHDAWLAAKAQCAPN
jgi:hypothetical protein